MTTPQTDGSPRSTNAVVEALFERIRQIGGGGVTHDEVAALVASELGSKPTIVQAAVQALNDAAAGKDLVLSSDKRLQRVIPDDPATPYVEVYVDSEGLLAFGVREDGSVDIPILNAKMIQGGVSKPDATVIDGVSIESFSADGYMSGTVDKDNRLAEDALDFRGRTPDWVLTRWYNRMLELSGGSPGGGTGGGIPTDPSVIPQMDILIGAGQSNMGSTSDPYATDVEFPMIPDYIYEFQDGVIRRIADGDQSLKTSRIPRAIFAFALEYGRTQLKPGRGILIANSAVGSSGFSTTTITPPPEGYKNIMSGSTVNMRTGSWEVDFTQDPNNLYRTMINYSKLAKTEAPAGSRYVAFLWSQGESDVTMRTPQQYATLFDQLVSSMRTELATNIPVLVGSMNPNWVDGLTSRKNLQAILEDTPRRIYKSAYAWGPANLGDMQSNIHWSAQGQTARGPIFMAAFERARWNVAAAEPAAPQNVQTKRIGPNLLVTWEHPPSSYTSIVLEYKIDSGAWTEAELPGPSVREITLSLSLAATSIVSVRMKTVNTVGTSEYTREVLA